MTNKSIEIFYHVYQFGNWQQTYQDQMHKIFSSGLNQASQKINICVVGGLNLPFAPENAVVRHFVENNNEADTLRVLHSECVGSKILYIHTKGVTKNSSNCNFWRLYMEYFLIENWKYSINFLKQHDCVGVNWKEKPIKHFSGNMWWSNLSYLKKLDPNKISNQNRMSCEFWIGLGNPKYKCLHNSGVDHYRQAYPPNKYMGFI